MVPAQFLDVLAYRADLVRIQPDCRFVENEQFRLVHQRIGQPHALAIAFGERTDHPVLHIG